MTELCFNLWYYLDTKQNLVNLAAKAYMLEGTDEAKAAVLEKLSSTDYQTAHKHSPPSQEMHYSKLQLLGIDTVFDEVFNQLRNAAPYDVSFPEDKLYFATPMFDFGQGFVPAKIGNGFIGERI